MGHRVLLVSLALFLTACSSSSPQKKAAPATGQRVPASPNPVAKYVELSGFRIIEKKPGTLAITFAVTNHSDADIGNIEMTVNLRTTAAKPDDPPLATFTSRVEGLGPEELKEAHAEIPTKMRAYELPDWQFLTADFQVADSK